jgi:hypothetical protein
MTVQDYITKENELMSQTARIYNNIERAMIPFNRMSEISRQMSGLKTVTCAIPKTKIPSFDSGVMSKLQDYSNFINKVKGSMMAVDTVWQIAEKANYPLKSLKPIQNMLKSSSTLSYFASEQAGIMASLKTITIANNVFNGTGVVRSLYRVSPLVALGLDKEFAGIDFDRLSGITDRVLSTFDMDSATETAEHQAEGIVQRILDEYNSKSKNDVSQTTAPVKKLSADNLKFWLEYIALITTLICNIFNVAYPVISDRPNSKVTYNQKVETTRIYCRNICMYTSKDLNDNKYRIINRDVVARLGHDCHSRIIARLDAGDIVRISRKHKKWRLILWNDGKKECTGWVQNYKLSQF